MKATIKYVCYSLMLSLVVFGCGKKDDGGGGGTSYNAYGNYCVNQPGTVPTTQCGCVPQGNCAAGMAMCNGQCVSQGIPNNGYNCQPGMPNYPNCNTTCQPGMPNYPNCNNNQICQPGMPNYPNCNTTCQPGMPGCTGGQYPQPGGSAAQYAAYICQYASYQYGQQMQAIQHPWCPSGWACSSGYSYGCVIF